VTTRERVRLLGMIQASLRVAESLEQQARQQREAAERMRRQIDGEVDTASQQG
jgi:hypothetical protein